MDLEFTRVDEIPGPKKQKDDSTVARLRRAIAEMKIGEVVAFDQAGSGVSAASLVLAAAKVSRGIPIVFRTRIINGVKKVYIKRVGEFCPEWGEYQKRMKTGLGEKGGRNGIYPLCKGLGLKIFNGAVKPETLRDILEFNGLSEKWAGFLSSCETVNVGPRGYSAEGVERFLRGLVTGESNG